MLKLLKTSMSTLDTLHTFLSLHLANDDTAAYHTPIILSGLHSQNVESSPNLSKWMNRINRLIDSRNSGARWSGLCLALETAKLSKNVMMGSGQTWATVVLPILSVSGLLTPVISPTQSHANRGLNLLLCGKPQ